jgi:cell division protein FtsW
MSVRVEPGTRGAPPVGPEQPDQPDEQGRQPNTLRLMAATTAALVGMGLIMVLSASSVEAFKTYGSSFLFFRKQLLGALMGVVALVIMARIDYRRLRRFTRPLFWLTLALLVAVLLPGVGISGGGSSRWISFGPLTIQPSEMAKLALILVSAHMLERKGSWVGDFRELTMPVIPMTALACLLMLIQPDLGTAIISLASVSVVLFLAGARLRHLGAIVGSAGLVGGMLILSKGYQRQRFLAYLHPWADPLKGGYQIIQGQIALGSGGWFGVGLGASRQKWSFLPNAHTDFIFAIIGEELGLIGTLVVLAAFSYFVYLGIRIAREAPDRFGCLVAAGITSWIGIQAVINIGAVTGILPVTGVPLPLISFGGTSLVVTMAGIGILLSIARQTSRLRQAGAPGIEPADGPGRASPVSGGRERPRA